jgi:CheY-like chemotaxis protein
VELRNKRIFVVEDNVENRVIYQMIFIREGATVEFERWGPDAIYKLNRFKPVDLIILDLMLTMGTSGYGLFEEIRKHPDFDGVPIVAVSSADASEAIPRTQRMGFSGYISKPIDQAQFPKQLCSIMAGEAVWDAG